MAASVEKYTSTGALPLAVPWLHTVTATCTLPPDGALGDALTWVMTRSGLSPTPTRFPAVALLSSISSVTLLNMSTMAPM